MFKPCSMLNFLLRIAFETFPLRIFQGHRLCTNYSYNARTLHIMLYCDCDISVVLIVNSSEQVGFIFPSGSSNGKCSFINLLFNNYLLMFT